MLPLNLIALTWLFASANGSNPLSATPCSFGEAYLFSTAECRFRISNASDREVTASIKAQLPDDVANPSSVVVPPHGSVEVTAIVAINNGAGEGSHFFRVHAEGSSGRDFYARADGFGLTALDDAYPRADFGSVDLSEKVPDAIRIAMDSHDGPAFRIDRVISSPKGVDASIAPDGHSVELTIRSDAPWGVLDDNVKLAIDTPHQKQAWIAVKAEIHGDISASNNPFWTGMVPPDAERKFLIPLQSKQGRDFRIGNISLRDIDGHARVVPCEVKAAGCKAIELRISAEQHAGPLRGVVNVDLPDFSKSLAITVWGVLQHPRADSARAATEARQNGSVAATATGGANSAAAQDSPSDAAPKSAAGTPAGRGPLLKWTVVDDGGVHGYQVFRSTSESGPFVLVNTITIPANAAHAKGTNAYQWRDEAAESGKTYWYYIGAVGKDGTKRKLSNPQKKVVTE